jgi:hypothetical protein
MSIVTSRFMHANVTIMSSCLVIYIAFKLLCNLYIKHVDGSYQAKANINVKVGCHLNDYFTFQLCKIQTI